MEVNSQKIKKLRTERAFTQQHLADACDISLRTIQRVERYGTASSETVMSLSAVFDVDSETLVIAQEQPTTSTKSDYLFALFLMLACLSGAIVGSLGTYLIVS